MITLILFLKCCVSDTLNCFIAHFWKDVKITKFIPMLKLLFNYYF